MDWQVQLTDAEAHRPASADEAVKALMEGNARFSARQGNPGGLFPPTATDTTVVKQAPVCIILGCADARVPAEIVFGTGPNRLFMVRVAGNVLGDECLGSIEYAITHFPDTVKLVMVLGHTACGAVAAAVESYLSPKQLLSESGSRSLRAVVAHIAAAVRTAVVTLEQVYGMAVHADPGYKAALAELAVPVNAAVNAYYLRQELQPPADAPYQVVFSVFDLISGAVAVPGLDGAALRPAPTSADELAVITRDIAAGPAVRRHLQSV